MELTFAPWQREGISAKLMQYLLNDRDIWEQQRTDACDQLSAIHGDYSGAYVGFFSFKELPMGFVMFLPSVDWNHYEMHMGFFRCVTPLNMATCLLTAIDLLFQSTPCEKIVAPCPDWNPQIDRLARILKRRYRVTTKAMPLDHLSVRDGQSFGATVHAITREEWESKLELCH